MFAGEGDPMRTNRRFHLLASGQPATRLSTAFDSVTLYGFDPEERPDIYGKIGTSGVSIATLDDMRDLFDGFDLCDPATSVSMTINGPAPAILAMYLNAAIDQQLGRHRAGTASPPPRRPRPSAPKCSLWCAHGPGRHLEGGSGPEHLHLLDRVLLGVMADVQQYFIDHAIKSFYSVSVSGYHIAEAARTPSRSWRSPRQRFTYVEAYLARGMAVDDFAPNFSFFFSNGMDPEYTVIGRWPAASGPWRCAERYGASGEPRSSSTTSRLRALLARSGDGLQRHPHHLQALCASYDNANSLHTNAYDEGVTTPTDESVRRALAIQLVIQTGMGALGRTRTRSRQLHRRRAHRPRRRGGARRVSSGLSERGGVLGAMETGYQRGRIQDDSMLYEEKKHDGTRHRRGEHLREPAPPEHHQPMELARATEEEKEGQLADSPTSTPATPPSARAPSTSCAASASRGQRLRGLMSTVRHASLGQITQTLFEVGGSYRPQRLTSITRRGVITRTRPQCQ